MTVDRSVHPVELAPGEVTVPELAPLLLDAQSRGQTSVALICTEDAGRWSVATFEGTDVRVTVEYQDADRETAVDEMALANVWKLAAADVTITGLRGPDTGPRPALFTAVTFHPVAGFAAHIVDQRGSVGGLTSCRRLPDGRVVGDEIRHLIARFAQPQERSRAFEASQAIGTDAYRGAFDAGAAMHLLEDPGRRGAPAHGRVNGVEGFPLAAWSAQWQKDDEWHNVGNFRSADPVSRTATAAITAVAVEAVGKSELNAIGSNVRHVAYWDERRPDQVRLPAVRDRQPSKQTNALEWRDDTGDLATLMADGHATVERVASELGAAGIADLLQSYRGRGLDDREVRVLVAIDSGLTLQEVGDQIGRHHRTVGRILAGARQKLATE